jgi:hypothetical protein
MPLVNCDNCNIVYHTTNDRVNKNTFNFCSQPCSLYHRKFNVIRKNHPSPLHRFKYAIFKKRSGIDF